MAKEMTEAFPKCGEHRRRCLCVPKKDKSRLPGRGGWGWGDLEKQEEGGEMGGLPESKRIELLSLGIWAHHRTGSDVVWSYPPTEDGAGDKGRLR